MRLPLLLLALLAPAGAAELPPVAWPTVTLTRALWQADGNRLTIEIRGSGPFSFLMERHDDLLLDVRGQSDEASCAWATVSEPDEPIRAWFLCGVDLDSTGGSATIVLYLPPAIGGFWLHQSYIGPERVSYVDMYAGEGPLVRVYLPLAGGGGGAEPKAAAFGIQAQCVPGTRESGEYDIRRWIDDGTRYGRWEILPCQAPPPPPTPEPGPPLTPRVVFDWVLK